MNKNTISVIIPILNEVDFITKLLEHLITVASQPSTLEIIIVDGGSTDGTLDVLKSERFSKKIKVVASKKGRAKQMNLGAKQASGDILYFLHADSFPPKHFDQLIRDNVEKGNIAGCFRMQFNSAHWWLRLMGWFTQFSWRACRGGDQSQFITKTLFDDIGGYNENYTIYEDNILINTLYKKKQFTVIPQKLKTSARLYKSVGVWTLQYYFLVIYLKKGLGASADELLGYYKKHIKNA